MKILVCLKQILDPEAPPRDFQIDPDQKVALQGNSNLVTNIFCENALETALQLKEKEGGEITALTFGPASAENVLRKALAMKADHACLIENSSIDSPNSAVSAQVLGAAAKHLGDFDLILAGREAGDWGAGQTGGFLAEELKLPFVGFVDSIEKDGEQITVHRQTDSGAESIACSLPLAITITNSDDNLPRIPKTRDIMMSSRKPLTKLTLEELGIDSTEMNELQNRVEVTELFIPQKETNCEFVEGDSLDEKIDGLAQKIVSVLQST